MEILAERLLWHIYNAAEGYTLLLFWIVIPLGFWAVYLFLSRISTPIENPLPSLSLQDAKSNHDETNDKSSGPPKETKVNLNEANA